MPYYPDIEQRMAELRTALRTDKAGIGRLAGVSKTASGNWFSGRARPDRDALANLRKNANVNPDWLIEGKGPMFMSQTMMVRDEGESYSAGDENMLLARYRTLDQKQRAALLAFIAAFTKLPTDNEPSSSLE